MAVLPTDLIAPNGPVEPEMFPGQVTDGDSTDLELRLEAYISKAILKATSDGFVEGNRDAAVEAWALYLTFQAAHTLAVMRPAQEDAQMALLGSTQYAEDQRAALLKRANEFKQDYLDAQDALDSQGRPISKGANSFQSRVEYDW